MVPDFSTLLQRRTEVVLPLAAEELERAIRSTSRLRGLDTRGGAGRSYQRTWSSSKEALPLLRSALTELFERRAGRRLTAAAYRSIGGVLGALGRRAGEVYAGWTRRRNPWGPPSLFLRLVALGEGTEDTRRRALRAELEALGGQPPALGWEVRCSPASGKPGCCRSIATRSRAGRPSKSRTEALLREWRRLHEWLDESRGEGCASIAPAPPTPRRNGRAQPAGTRASCLAARRLQQFEDWAASATRCPHDEERAYLEATSPPGKHRKPRKKPGTSANLPPRSNWPRRSAAGRRRKPSRRGA